MAIIPSAPNFGTWRPMGAAVQRAWDWISSGRTLSLGTGVRAPFGSDDRTASGWLPVRHPMKLFLVARRRLVSAWVGRDVGENSMGSAVDPALGTAQSAGGSTGVCAASGWLPAQAPVHACEEGSAGEVPKYHVPVMPAEVGMWMAVSAGGLIVDGTLGGGGHSEIFLAAGARVLGVDRDPEALAHARERLAAYGTRFATWEGNFAQLREIPALQDERADGLLLDLGVSSRQLDAAERGFSFMREGPLDMRMGPSSQRSAAEVVNDWSEADLAKLIFEFGEEPKARRIAAAIVRRRRDERFSTTTELAACIEGAIGRHSRIHPATRAFQAIRMVVNDELESLGAALESAAMVLKPGGRLLVITFHSLEDRMVKRFLRHRSAAFVDDPGWPEARPNPDWQYDLLVRKAISASAEECLTNPRARSAKLRVARLKESAP